MNKEKLVKVGILLIIDMLIINLAYIIGFTFKDGLEVGAKLYFTNFKLIPLLITGYILPLYAFNMYSSVWSLIGIHEAIKCFLCSSLGIIFTFIFRGLGYNLKPEIIILSGIIIFLCTVSSRMSFRILRRLFIYKELMNKRYKERTLIIGAGSSGNIVILEMLKNKDSSMIPIGIIDDNPLKRGKRVNGIEVLGDRNDIRKIVIEKKIDVIIMAISSIDLIERKKILEICANTEAKVRIIPGISEILEGKISLSKMREVNLKDLLGREQISLDKEGIKGYIKNRTILVTGGGGSIGSELCRQIIKYSPKKLIILDIYENNAYEIQNELLTKYPKINLRIMIASVRDRHRLEKIFNKENIDIVFHAAAHKHVPLMEDDPEEAIKNNVLGTLNVAECADKFKVKKFVLISTDKAVNPTNVMGATKRLCEMIIQGINKESNTEFVAVRFGNVLGSNGSVIPLFKKQIEQGGPITITHKEITRYFMLISEAAELVLQAGAYASGGEIFVLDMGKSVKIYDLAKNLIRLSGYELEKDIKIKVTGLRPGEKLYEELLMNEEGLKETENKKIFIGAPTEIDFNNLKKRIAEVVMISLNGDKESLKSALKKVVPTYLESKKSMNLAEEIAVTNQRE